MSLVEVENVEKVYTVADVSVTALSQINLAIEQGSFAALVGPSGSGKTTLLNIIGALDRPTFGYVRVADHSLQELNSDARADFRRNHVGFVFQSYNLISVLTARENVEYIQLLQGVPADQRRSRSMALLERVGLSKYCDTKPIHMSGGQRQRVAVARALAAQPALILADEPTANLDSNTGSALIKLFKELNQELGTTFILATHDPMVMDQIPQIVTLHDGRIMASDDGFL